jgi:Outer membrane protein beta-barrel domain
MRKLLLVTALALGAGAAHADDAGNGLFYVGAGVSRDTLGDIIDLGGLPDIHSTSWKVFAGVRPMSIFAVEADYMDLGSRTSTFIDDTTAHADAKAYAAYAVGFLPIPVPFLDIFGKAGLARWKLNGSLGTPSLPLPPASISFSDSGTEFAWGIGAQGHVGNIGGRLEYENFNIPNTDGARIVSLEVYLNLM